MYVVELDALSSVLLPHAAKRPAAATLRSPGARSVSRRNAGAPMVAWAIVGEDQLRVTRGEPAVYASSAHARRSFCTACGTGLFYRNPEFSTDRVDIQVAAMDDPDVFRPTLQVQVAERIGWMESAHALPAHDRFPEGA